MAVGFTPATLPQLGAAAVRAFIPGAIGVVIGAFVLVRSTPVWLRVVLGVVLILGIAFIAFAISLLRKGSSWNRLRAGQWKSLDVRVVPDQADGEVLRTLLDSTDSLWRIAIVEYPLALRDAMTSSGRLEYVGELGHDQQLLLRVAGSGALSEPEYFGVAKSRARLKEPS